MSLREERADLLAGSLKLLRILDEAKAIVGVRHPRDDTSPDTRMRFKRYSRPPRVLPSQYAARRPHAVSVLSGSRRSRSRPIDVRRDCLFMMNSITDQYHSSRFML